MATQQDISVLVVGRLATVLDDALGQLEWPGVTLRSARDLDGVRAAFERRPPEHLIMGAGLGLDVRLDVVREVFTRSDSTTVHMKDVASGPEGFLPFIRAVISGLLASAG